MKDTVVAKKRDNEGSMPLYRRFVKKFRSSGIQTITRRRRFRSRKPSKNVRKKDCITRITRHEAFEQAYRLGKITTTGRKGSY